MAEEKDISASSETPASSKKIKALKAVESQEMTTLHERTIAALSYISFLAIVPFYLKKDSAFCRFHGKQGMLLSIVFFIASLVSVLDLVFDILLVIQVSTFFIMGFAALSGRWKKLPLGYEWACQLEDVLSLKTKEEEIEALALKPNHVRQEEGQTPPPSPPAPPDDSKI